MSVYRYINNSSEPVVAGEHTVEAWNEIALSEPTDELNFKVGTYLTCYKDGIQLDEASLPILDYVEIPSQEEVRLELYYYPEPEAEPTAEIAEEVVPEPEVEVGVEVEVEVEETVVSDKE